MHWEQSSIKPQAWRDLGRDNLSEPRRGREPACKLKHWSPSAEHSKCKTTFARMEPSTCASDFPPLFPSQILYWSWPGSLGLAALMCGRDEEAFLNKEENIVSMGIPRRQLAIASTIPCFQTSHKPWAHFFKTQMLPEHFATLNTGFL